MIEIEPFHFPNVGFLKINLSEDQVCPIKEEVEHIQKNWDTAIEANRYLIGNIKKEYKLINNLEYVNNLLNSYIDVFEQNFQFLSKQNVLSANRPLIVDNAWVNFQEKHEFNPVHDHTGLLSFVIWLKIPYHMKEEIEQSPGYKSNSPRAGSFCFYYTNSLGQICHYGIPADCTMENSMLIFPAKLNHSVYPFYSSDEFRISVSGNMVFHV